MNQQRAVIILASYDYESLYLTLTALNHTLEDHEMVVVILNGKRGIRSAQVEAVAREWAKDKTNKFVVRPLNYGNDPYNSIKEILNDFAPLKNIDYICKIDDDLIPLKKGWLDSLQNTYLNREANEKIGFVTALINNNTWGFAELLKIFDKEAEYKAIMNYSSQSGEGLVKAGEVANGMNGTIWQYPYIAKWCHEWTTLEINHFIHKTANLQNKEIATSTHYSIGCIFFKKDFWHQLEKINKLTNFDELSVHRYCEQHNLAKIAVMNQPMAHLYYFVQRKANADLIPLFAQSFATFWQDERFNAYPKMDVKAAIAIEFEEFESKSVLQNFDTSFMSRVIGYIKRRLP